MSRLGSLRGSASTLTSSLSSRCLENTSECSVILMAPGSFLSYMQMSLSLRSEARLTSIFSHFPGFWSSSSMQAGALVRLELVKSLGSSEMSLSDWSPLKMTGWGSWGGSSTLKLRLYIRYDISETALPLFALSVNKIIMHIGATLTASELVTLLLEQAEQQIRTNEVIRHSLVPYTVHREQDNLDNLVTLNTFSPTRMPIPSDDEAMALGSDTLMGNPQKQEVFGKKRSQSKYSSVGSYSNMSQHQKMRSKASSQKSHPFASDSIPIKSHQLFKLSAVAEEDKEIEQLRILKAQQDEFLATMTGLKRNKMEVRLERNQRIVYDYSGRIEKGQDAKNGNFKNKVLQGFAGQQAIDSDSPFIRSPPKAQQIDRQLLKKHEQPKPKHTQRVKKQKKEGTKTPHHEPSNTDRDEIIRSIELKHPGVKINFDGENIKRKVAEELASRKSSQQGNTRAEYLKIQSQRVNQNQQRIRTEIYDLGEQPLPVKVGKGDKKRFRTEASSEAMTASQQIQIANQGLRDNMMRDGRYVQLPRNFHIKRATSQSSKMKTVTDDDDKYQIRQRLSSMRNQNDKLPRIITQSRNLEKHILKQVRKKTAY